MPARKDMPLSGVTREVLEPLWSRLDIPTARIAAHLGVTRQGLSWKAHSLGLPPRTSNRKTACDDDLFRRMWNAGVNLPDMARALGYSHRQAVRTRAVRLGLPNRERGQGTNTFAGWGSITLAQFREIELARIMARDRAA